MPTNHSQEPASNSGVIRQTAAADLPPAPSKPRFTGWKRWLLAAFAVLAFLVIAGGLGLYIYSPRLKDDVKKQLEDRFASTAEIQDFRLSIFPSPSVELGGLVFRHHGRTDVPPLIEAKRVRASAGWLALLAARRVGLVELEGLHIRVPPRERKKDREKEPSNKQSKKSSPLVVSKLIANGAVLEMLPKKAGKDPLQFEIYELTLRSVATDRPMDFEAKLKNAKPPGLITSQGKFGPWEKDEPGDTAVEGTYTFKDADLGVFKGIGGTLSSTGKYEGVLAELRVDGLTDTPNFTVDVGQHPIHLKSSFKAVVDGTSGETLLQPVHATFGRSEVLARGGVVDVEGTKGKAVRLDVVVSKGRLEDMMLFGVKGEPPITGAMRFQVKFDLPPGPENVVDKLRLDGHFGVDEAQMTKSGLQEKLEGLSDKAKGKPNDPKTGDVESEFKGKFKLANSTINLAELSFTIPGASLVLNGTYGLRTEKLDFRGVVRLDAKVSETTTGWKSMLLKVADPLFKRKDQGAGSEIPIRIGGTREQPSFNLDVGKAVSPGK